MSELNSRACVKGIRMNAREDRKDEWRIHRMTMARCRCAVHAQAARETKQKEEAPGHSGSMPIVARVDRLFASTPRRALDPFAEVRGVVARLCRPRSPPLGKSLGEKLGSAGSTLTTVRHCGKA